MKSKYGQTIDIIAANEDFKHETKRILSEYVNDSNVIVAVKKKRRFIWTKGRLIAAASMAAVLMFCAVFFPVWTLGGDNGGGIIDPGTTDEPPPKTLINSYSSLVPASMFNSLEGLNLEPGELNETMKMQILNSYMDYMRSIGVDVFGGIGSSVFFNKYYGTYNGYAAVLIGDHFHKSITANPTRIVYVDDIPFCYNSVFRILVFKDGNFYSLHDAYDQELLTRIHIKNIAYFQNEGKFEYLTRPKYPEELSAELENQIKQAYFDSTSTLPRNADLEDIWIDTYYGTYNDYVAVIVRDIYRYYPERKREVIIADTAYYYDCAGDIVLFKNGKFYELESAYDNLQISQPDLQRIAFYQNHLTTPNNAILDEETIARIKQDYVTAAPPYRYGYYSPQAEFDDLTVHHCGTYNGYAVVLIIDAQIDYTSVSVTDFVNLSHPASFNFRGYKELLVWKEGIFYDIKYSYENGLLTKNDLASIAYYTDILYRGNAQGTAKQETIVITTAAELAQLAREVNGGNDTSGKTYVLENDINLNIEPYNAGDGWVPIGKTDPFRGIFDGNGKKITGLYINSKNNSRTGLFGVISGFAKVKNLIVEKADIRSGDNGYTGGIAGIFDGDSIENCYFSGTIQSTGNNIGGLAGNSNGKISNCGVAGAISGNNWVGGITGFSLSEISSSHFKGIVNGIGNNIGGIAGFARNSIKNSYSKGVVEGNRSIGGIAGDTYSCVIQNCYSTSMIAGKYELTGGIAGELSSTIVKDCIALNPLIETTFNGGRVIGAIWNAKNSQIQNNFAIDNMTVLTNGFLKALDKGRDKIDGMDVGENTFFTASFWITPGNWNDGAWSTDAWVFKDGKLPLLRETLIFSDAEEWENS